ncbi:hypothetical protein F4777DRAFT_559812 [Nemania sp. FL0916]|nr:hypothetical protein F4777DRAFT_559812 [Nemania sp. FL0916]
MGLFGLSVLYHKGWRRTGIINVILTYICTLALLICLIISISQPGASLLKSNIIFQGSCTTSTNLSLFLHLLLNGISTAILASSNFFMQILSAPSRHEIDSAHQWLRALDIGIPSIKNLSHMSRLKTASWIVFLISSLPIHLFFNSAVFETTYLDSRWTMTLATEAFTKGAAFFPPGASLSPAGEFNSPNCYGNYSRNEKGCYGGDIPISQYWDVSSDIVQDISSMAKEAHSWVVLDAVKCQREYVSCNSRKAFDDLVVIVDSGPSSSSGWARSEVFNFDPSSNLSTFWDAHIPPNNINSLWFSAQCNITREISASGKEDTCTHTCLGALGVDAYTFQYDKRLALQDPWNLKFFQEARNKPVSPFSQDFKYNDTFDVLSVHHCYAKPASPTCKVGVSNTLLLIVILSILVKAVQGTIIVWKLPSESLVTPGDAIQSFISDPDPYTRGLSTLDILDSQRLEFGLRRHWPQATNCGLTTIMKARRWARNIRRLRAVIPYSAWVTTYSVLFAGVILLSACLAGSAIATRNDYTTSLDHTNGVLTVNLWAQPLSYIATLLLANLPQLILSFCYFAYNSLITRLRVEVEWNNLSSSYQPLRVSYPVGQQISTYRLQLPYRYGVPLIIISIVLHWFLSNAVFLFVFEGGYWTGASGTNDDKINDSFSVSHGSLIAIGYSPFFFLVLFVASFVFIIIPPIILGFQKLQGDMVVGGWNSLVISAACHRPDIADSEFLTPQARELDEQLAHRTSRIEPNTSSDHDLLVTMLSETNVDSKLDLAKRKIRWGAMALPGNLAEAISPEDGTAILHLGFGGEEHDVKEPLDGGFYL